MERLHRFNTIEKKETIQLISSVLQNLCAT